MLNSTKSEDEKRDRSSEMPPSPQTTICCSEGDEGYVYEGAKGKIAELTKGYAEKPNFFADLLACRVGTIAAAFYPKAVVVRMSDFKSNEYANLFGSSQFEPQAENPVMGLRGAS
jgi:phosphoenolpyruvate synthase/pyruvate phosphate dikinase